MDNLTRLSSDPRVSIRRPGAPNANGQCVVYWMQRSQRAGDNHALDVAIAAAGELKRPTVVFFALCRFILARTCGTTHFWRRHRGHRKRTAQPEYWLGAASLS